MYGDPSGRSAALPAAVSTVFVSALGLFISMASGLILGLKGRFDK